MCVRHVKPHLVELVDLAMELSAHLATIAGWRNVFFTTIDALKCVKRRVI